MTIYYGQIQVVLARKDARNNELQTCLTWVNKHRMSEHCSSIIEQGPVETWKREESAQNDRRHLVAVIPPGYLAMIPISIVRICLIRRLRTPLDQL
jgi:hypothetical protein